MTDLTGQFCQARMHHIYSAGTHRCGNPAKGTGVYVTYGIEGEGEIPLCGVHLRVVTQREARDAEREAEIVEANRVRAEVEAIILTLPPRIQGLAYPEYRGGYTGKVSLILDADQARNIRWADQ